MKFPAWFFFLSTTFVIYLWPAVAKSNPDFAHNFRWVEDFSLLLLWLARKRNDRLAPPPPPFPPLLHLQRNVLRPQERGRREEEEEGNCLLFSKRKGGKETKKNKKGEFDLEIRIRRAFSSGVPIKHATTTFSNTLYSYKIKLTICLLHKTSTIAWNQLPYFNACCTLVVVQYTVEL